MTKFHVYEHTHAVIEADNGKAALDTWLNQNFSEFESFTVDERQVLDDQGEFADIEDD